MSDADNAAEATRYLTALCELDFAAAIPAAAPCLYGMCTEDATMTLQLSRGPLPACNGCVTLHLGFQGYHDISGTPTREWLDEITSNIAQARR